MGEHSQRRFCVVTSGRAGSTALMDAIATHREVAVPALQVECRHHELLLPSHAQRYAASYARLAARPVEDPDALVEAFFDVNAARRWAGFKTMPNRHRDPRAFFSRADIRFIVLLREDIVATAASFLLALTRGTWRRHGGTPPERIVFSAGHRPMLLSNLAYLHASRRFLEALPGAIQLRYEDLCRDGFSNAGLDAFFERAIRIEAPLPPTRAESYVDNLDELASLVHDTWRRLDERGERR